MYGQFSANIMAIISKFVVGKICKVNTIDSKLNLASTIPSLYPTYIMKGISHDRHCPLTLQTGG